MAQEMIEIGVDDVLFHLDVVLPARFSKDQKTQRYISPSLSLIVDVLTMQYPTESRVTMQSRYSDDEPYQMRNVAAIYAIGQRKNFQSFLCECDGERIAIRTDDDAETSAEPVKIWPRHNHLAWSLLSSAEVI